MKSLPGGVDSPKPDTVIPTKLNLAGSSNFNWKSHLIGKLCKSECHLKAKKWIRFYLFQNLNLPEASNRKQPFPKLLAEVKQPRRRILFTVFIFKENIYSKDFPPARHGRSSAHVLIYLAHPPFHLVGELCNFVKSMLVEETFSLLIPSASILSL